MGRPRRIVCSDCERHLDECGPLSARGLCGDCGERRLRDNIVTMIATRGAGNDKWRRRMLEYGQALVDILGDE